MPAERDERFVSCYEKFPPVVSGLKCKKWALTFSAYPDLRKGVREQSKFITSIR
jgi:hypothetical protein